MQQFKISEEGYRKFRKKWLTIFIPTLLIGMTIVVLITSRNSRNEDFISTLIAVSVMIIFLGITLYRGLKKQKKMLMSYSITISEEGITREQMNTRPLSISFMEIREIVKSEKGNFTIKGVGRTDVINIPYWIDDHAGLEQQLQTLAPLKLNTKDPWHKKYGTPLSFLVMGLMFGVFYLNNKVIVGICGVLLTGFLIWSFFEVRTSKNIPENTKRMSWVFLIVIFSVAYATYAKLTGQTL